MDTKNNHRRNEKFKRISVLTIILCVLKLKIPTYVVYKRLNLIVRQLGVIILKHLGNNPTAAR